MPLSFWKLKSKCLFISVLVFELFVSQTTHAVETTALPILVIGGSYDNGPVPIQDNIDGPIGGISVGLGSYLSLGHALIRDSEHSGFVINEAQAGSGTFQRSPCGIDTCATTYWESYDTQLTKALMRVTVRNPADPSQILVRNAKYLVIGLPNDCLHADAFGIPQNLTAPCDINELNAMMDRMIAIGQRALDEGLIPVYPKYAASSDLDLALSAQVFGLAWMVDNIQYEEIRALHATRIATDLPQAILIDAWTGFEHIGDGLHPNPKTARKAAHRIIEAIQQHESGL